MAAKKKTNKLLIIGNWKMNPPTLGKAKQLMMDIRKGFRKRPDKIDLVVAPPFPFISEMERLSPSQRILIAAQDMFFETTGAHTGEVSLPMLKSVGVSLVIVGHSERRARGETDKDIYKDIQQLLKHKVTAVICVGEKQRDPHGNFFGVVEAQLRAALRDVRPVDLKHIVIAYEPVWAIGTGKVATPEDAHEMKLFIQKLLADRFNRKAAGTVRILYGGSVKADNAEALLKEGMVDGFLVGGASLKATEFVNIVRTAEQFHEKTTKR